MFSHGLEGLARRAREFGEDVAMVARLTRDLPGFLRTTLSFDEARTRVLQHLATREQRFLGVVERAIYGYARSPYLALLRSAGCELGDVRALVAREGLDGALRTLAEQGVYVTFDELKGRREAVRGSWRATFRPADFDNPLVRPHFLMRTGGSGGRPSRVRYPLAFVEEIAEGTVITLAAHGVHQPRAGFWWPVALARMVEAARLGYPIAGWFYPVHPLPTAVHLVARYLVMLGQIAGRKFPLPKRCDLEEPGRMVEWLADQVRTGQSSVLWAMPSAGMRIGIAATAAGRDLRGVTLFVGGEAVTDTRREQMEASGAQVIVQYSSIELARLANSCATPTGADDVHVMLSQYAMARRTRAVSSGGLTVDALLMTALSPAAPTVALNAELGDFARVEERECGCLLGELGMRTHLSEIRSFEKLTGEGVSFARSNLERILEEVLPARFGGRSLDYQVVEEEAQDGVPRLVLRVSPSVGAVDETALRDALLVELARGSTINQGWAMMWRNAGTVQIRREEPVATRVGKVLPFQVLGRQR